MPSYSRTEFVEFTKYFRTLLLRLKTGYMLFVNSAICCSVMRLSTDRPVPLVQSMATPLQRLPLSDAPQIRSYNWNPFHFMHLWCIRWTDPMIMHLGAFKWTGTGKMPLVHGIRKPRLHSHLPIVGILRVIFVQRNILEQNRQISHSALPQPERTFLVPRCCTDKCIERASTVLALC